MDGTVISVFLNRGFCFVRGEDRISRFAHVRDFTEPTEFDTLRTGSAVTFTPLDIGRSERHDGRRAVDVKVKNGHHGAEERTSQAHSA